MAKITRLKAQKNKKRVNVYLDGQFAFGLDADNLLKAGLKVGQELTEKQVENLVFKNESQKLLDKACRFLSYRPRSEKEVRDYLKRKKGTMGYFETYQDLEKFITVLNEESERGNFDRVKILEPENLKEEILSLNSN